MQKGEGETIKQIQNSRTNRRLLHNNNEELQLKKKTFANSNYAKAYDYI